jgi:hypothetical protein
MTETVLTPERLVRAIKALPDKNPLDREDLCSEMFLLHRELDLSVYYAPFDYINPNARIALVGITPGWQQMEFAFRVTRNGLHNGLNPLEAMMQAKRLASFAGPMRRNLVEMLDGIGLPEALGVSSSSALFEDRQDLVHTTSAIRYPVFVGGRNYSGHKPTLMRSPALITYVRTLLAEELEMLPAALIVPLGEAAKSAIDDLVDRHIIDSRRYLRGLPHPSWENTSHRVKQFPVRRDSLLLQVRNWFETRPSTSSLPTTRPKTEVSMPIPKSTLRGEPSPVVIAETLTAPGQHSCGQSGHLGTSIDEQRYSREFCFEHVEGDLLYPIRMHSQTSGRLAFQVWDRNKSEAIEVEEEEMVRLVLQSNFAVRMKCPWTGRNGGYRRSGYSVRAVRQPG